MACTTYKYGDLGDGLFYHVLPTLLVYIVFFFKYFLITVLPRLFIYLVGGSKEFYFSIQLGTIIFQRGRSTTNQLPLVCINTFPV